MVNENNACIAGIDQNILDITRNAIEQSNARLAAAAQGEAGDGEAGRSYLTENVDVVGEGDDDEACRKRGAGGAATTKSVGS